MGEFLGYVAQNLGDAINGILQIITDFINLVISVIPNPDPFPEMIENLPDSAALDMGLVWYWLDAFAGVDTCTTILAAWAGVMVLSGVFAVVYWVIKTIKP